MAAIFIGLDPSCPELGLFGWDTVFDNDNASTDWAFAGPKDAPSNVGGMSNIAALDTAVQIGLFTDRACPPDHPLREWAGDDPRGYWGDGVLANDERPLGSLLWLLRNSVATEQTRRWAEVFALDGLQPLIDSGACARIAAAASILPLGNGIYLQVSLYAQDGLKIYNRKFELAWRQVIPRAIGLPIT